MDTSHRKLIMHVARDSARKLPKSWNGVGALTPKLEKVIHALEAWHLEEALWVLDVVRRGSSIFEHTRIAAICTDPVIMFST